MHLDTVRATDDPTSVGPVDVVFMCAKLYQLDDAMDVASPLVGPDTTVLGLQNGVTAADRLIQRFGAKHVVGVGTTVASVPLTIGEWPRGTSARTRVIMQLFKETAINAEGEPGWPRGIKDEGIGCLMEPNHITTTSSGARAARAVQGSMEWC
jgi:ketopantoate reductase